MPAGVAGTFHNRGGCWGSLLSGLALTGSSMAAIGGLQWAVAWEA
jgi:hypothetical protein